MNKPSMKSTTKKQIKAEDKAIDASVAFLRSHGWKPVVAGFRAIEQGSEKYSFRLVFQFVGKKPNHKKTTIK